MLIEKIQQQLQTIDLTQCHRLFHGRGHAYEGLEAINIDWFSPVVLITLYKDVESDWLAKLATELTELLPSCRSIQAQYRFKPKAPTEILWGKPIDVTQVTEHGLKYHIQLGKSQNVGLFLDMANGRQWVMDHANDKRVLNLFSYTCAFSIAAIAGGAEKVVNIDMAKASLAKGRDNHRLNGHDVSSIVFEGVDIFKSYNRLKKYGPYQLLICDPPSFQKGSVKIERDYKKIIKRIPQWLSPNSDVLLCLNSPDLSEQFLLDEVARECPECVFQQRIANPEVFVESIKGKGLKVLHFRYLPTTT